MTPARPLDLAMVSRIRRRVARHPRRSAGDRPNGGRHVIATCGIHAYCAGMVLARLTRVLTLLAVLLAPLTMMASHASAAAVPMAHTMSDSGDMPGHCPASGDEQGKQMPAPNIDCTIMCSAMPTGDNAFASQIDLPDLDLVQPIELGRHGLNPSADPPPPRFS